MKNFPRRSPIFRVAAEILVPTQLFLGIPLPAVAAPPPDAVAMEAPQDTDKNAPASPRVGPNRSIPKVEAPPPVPRFSAEPKESEFFKARVFAEPLVPSRATSPEENIALADALTRYLAAKDRADLSSIESFIERNPGSAWRTSLLANLAIAYRRTGHFSRALAASSQAWKEGADAEKPMVRALAERGLGELAALHSRLGHREELEKLLSDVAGRPLSGPAAELVTTAAESLSIMNTRPEIAYRCGPLAIDNLLVIKGASAAERELVRATESTPRGTSLAQMASLAARVGMPLQMAFRETRAAVLTPALVHWKAGHFGALVKQEHGRYLLQDPTFGDETWLGQAAIDDEASGFFLVPAGRLPNGWRVVSPEEGDGIWGKGVPHGQNPQPQTCAHKKQCVPCHFLAGYTFLEMLAALNITDTPVGYSPPRGPAIQFTVNYNQRDVFQPQIFTYSNLGPKWTFDWLSYVTDDPGDSGQTVTAYLRGGGEETYKGFSAIDHSYSIHYESGAQLYRTGTTTIEYERRMPDGSVEVFGQPDGALAFPRKVFLTKLKDPQGNEVRFVYDAEIRLVAVVDAINQVTTLDYELSTDPLKITRVTDPFGRSAVFSYDPTGKLAKITDAIGLTSELSYDPSDFVTTLDTPYGTSRFAWGTVVAVPASTGRYLEMTDPLGGKERVEYQPGHLTPLVAASDPAGDVPAGFEAGNALGHLDAAVTFYWDKRAMALYPGDYSKAEITTWLFDSAVKRTYKKPLESRIWYHYPGGSIVGAYWTGSSAHPITMARRLDDASTQTYRHEYGARGNVTRETDPLGRATIYNYDPTGMDLLEVRQVNGQTTDLLSSYTYNSQHQPLTVTDTSGQTTTNTYLPDGRLETVVTPPRGSLTPAERTTTYDYYPDDAPTGAGKVQTITGPSTPQGPPTTSYTYDGYGRVRTVTDSDDYTLTYDYDALDRVTRVTYPDTSSEETVYNRLDAEKRLDRLGRSSETFHDPLRRPTVMRDAAGRSVTQVWCNCGSLDKLIDAKGNQTTWERDLQGRVTRELRANGSAKEYTYEARTSRLQKIKDAKNQEISYSYFLDDKLQRTDYKNSAGVQPDPNTPSVAYTYDPIYGRVATMTDGTGATVYSYNAVGLPPALGAAQLANVNGPLTSPDDMVSYTYDELGRSKTRILSGVTTTWNYDALGRLTSLVDSVINTFTYTYEGTTGRPDVVSYPNGQTTDYDYFANAGDRRLMTIHHKKPGGATLVKFDYTYDKVGNIATWRHEPLLGADPGKYEFLYDAADQLRAALLKNDATQAPSKSYGYAYDPAGNRTVEAIDAAVTTSSFDNMNRLSQQVAGGALPVVGFLDEATKTVTINSAPAAVTGANDHFQGQVQAAMGQLSLTVTATDASNNARTNTYQVTVTGAAKTMIYDPNGNLTSDGVKTYEWDAENRLLTVKQGGNALASFAYDGEGRRATKAAGGVTTSYVYDGLQFLEERPSAGSTKRFVYASGIDQTFAQVVAGATTYNVADHLGSVVRATDTGGNPTLTRDYDPWGNPLQGSATSGYAFTGREWDVETSLYYYRARFYSPQFGRFLSEDPIGMIGSLNLFQYVRNRPNAMIDPLGYQGLPPTWDDCKKWASAGFEICKQQARAQVQWCNAVCDECEKSKPKAAAKCAECVECTIKMPADIQKKITTCEDKYRQDMAGCCDKFSQKCHPSMLPTPPPKPPTVFPTPPPAQIACNT